MKPDLVKPLSAYLLALADDELILGHRDSEWCGHAPILEEDIAFANLALDEIGHAQLWYTLVADLAGEDIGTYPDRLVYFREASEFLNLQMLELPRSDWAFSILRQYLFDALEKVRLGRLANSQYRPIAETAAKIQREELYHYRHSEAWVRRLGLGTEESRQRMQNSLDLIWPYLRQPFIPIQGEAVLVEAGYVPESAVLQAEWEKLVLLLLENCGLAIPDTGGMHLERGKHTVHMKILLAEMQSIARSEPEGEW
jgi:ring-1,2-phenylacetyl-CoA epoxidase subunit PaaC